jgi:hypothetical protein
MPAGSLTSPSAGGESEWPSREAPLFARIASFCLVAAFAIPAAADELADKVCPLLERVASELGDKVAAAVQADLVIAIGGAYDFDGAALSTVTDNIDASASANCPAPRDAILERLGMQTLQEPLR